WPKAATASQLTHSASRSRFPRTATTCGSLRDASTHIWGAQSHRCDSLQDLHICSAGGGVMEMASIGPEVAALAAPLLQEAQPVDARCAIEGLAGVIQAERGDRRGGQGFHLDAGAVHRVDVRADADPPGDLIGFDRDLGSC